VVDHRSGFHYPRIGASRMPVAATLCAHDPCLLLSLADIEHTFALAKAPQVLLREIVLALPLLEDNQINAFIFDKSLDVANEGLRRTPLRWNWSANTRSSLKPGRVAPDAFSGSHLPGRVSCSDGHFERALAPGCGEDLWRGVWPSAHAVPHGPTGTPGRQLTDTMVEHRSLTRSPPWTPCPLGQVGDGEGRSGGQGAVGNSTATPQPLPGNNAPACRMVTLERHRAGTRGIAVVPRGSMRYRAK
jgi:hypothetical protein